MHRDIKLDNLFIKEGRIVIGDFGFSTDEITSKTRLGTLVTMAPEMHLCQVYDNRIDLWSLGVIFYQLLYKKYPFYATTHS